MASRKILVTFAVSIVVLSSEPADACECIALGATCESAWRADAVFVGNVVSIESSSNGRRLVQLAVIEAFRGLQLSQVTVVGNSMCDYPFQMGQSYVVYAHRLPDGQFSATSCTTRTVSEAADDLNYLRSIRAIAPGSRARVQGRVQVSEWPPPPDGELRRVPRVTVTARGATRTFSARSNDRGEFELTGLPLGKYDVVARAPDGYQARPRSLEIHDPRGCGTHDLYLDPDGRVTGRVVNRQGVGIRGLPLELVSAAEVERPGGSRRLVQAWTAADGTFELKLVAPGEYVLGFYSLRGYHGELMLPRGFYPGVTEPTGATTIVVATAGERVRLRHFRVPQSIRLVAAAGVVVDEASRPVQDARISLRRSNPEGPSAISFPFVTDADGRFVFAVVEGQKYDVHVTRYVGSELGTHEVQVATVRFTATAGAPLLTVVVKPSRH